MTPLAHVGGGTLEPLQLAAPVAAGVAYLIRARTLARQQRPVPPLRQASFALGLTLVIVSLASPVAHLGEELLLAHMAQHLAMADLGALLIVLGLTGPMLQPILKLRAVDRLRALAHPAVALPLWVANLYLWHLPLLYQGALGDEWLHALQHASFVAFGINMWLSLFGPLPMPRWFGNGARLLYVVAVRLAGALLANVLMWSEVVLYPDYAPGEAEFGIAPLTDQAVAGVIMMVEGSILTIFLFGWLFMKAAGEGEERQRLLEVAAASGVELSERRAARAVAAGRGAELEWRLRRARPGEEAVPGSRSGEAGRPSRDPEPDPAAPG
jgi:cytochrome c oxidase assembly factor CtaG